MQVLPDLLVGASLCVLLVIVCGVASGLVTVSVTVKTYEVADPLVAKLNT